MPQVKGFIICLVINTNGHIYASRRERRFSGIGGMAETAEMAETQEILSGRASTALALRIIIILYNKIHHNNTVSMCCSEHQCFSMARPFHADAYRLEIIRTVLPAMLTIKANHTLKSLY